ncbi:MAG: helix-turn-helix domain-containing protein [Bryobacteraceae bacterium]
MDRFQSLKAFLDAGCPILLGPNGDRHDLPSEVFALMREAVAMLASGHEPKVRHEEPVMTTQEAADLLGMSRPHFVKLLEHGAMPHHRVGNQRRVYREDVLAYGLRRGRSPVSHGAVAEA